MTERGTPAPQDEVIVIPRMVIDGELSEPRTDTAVVVAGSVVEDVVALSDVSSARLRRATVMEAPDCALLPGLIDCHTHLVFDRYTDMRAIDTGSLESATLVAAKNAGILLDHGYTTVRDVGSRGAAAISVGRAIREGLVRGPRVFAGGQLISSTAGTADSYQPWITNSAGVGVVVDGVDELRREVRHQKKMGADHIKLGLSGSEPSAFCYTWMTTMSEEEIGMAIREAHRLGLRVACHSEAELSSLYAARHGANTIEHGTRLTEEAAGLMLRNGTVLVPTLCTLHGVLELGESLSLGRKQREEMEVNKEPWLASVALAHSMGVPIAAGGDIGNRYRHGENAKEIAYLAAAGLSPMEALQAATSVAAAVVGMEERLGRVKPGFLADLVLFEGEPLGDLTAMEDATRFKAVMREGRWVKGGPAGVGAPGSA